MTRIEIIERHERTLQECEAAGITVHDWRNAEIYRYVQKLRGEGNKMDYCVNQAMLRYMISEATVWRILRNMEAPV